MSMNDYLEDWEWVSAHRPDRMGSVVIGQLMPYDPHQGERVQDEAGDVWSVVSDSVRPLPIPKADSEAQS